MFFAEQQTVGYKKVLHENEIAAALYSSRFWTTISFKDQQQWKQLLKLPSAFGNWKENMGAMNLNKISLYFLFIFETHFVQIRIFIFSPTKQRFVNMF